MSARVLNPIMFTEFCKLRASPSASQIQRNLASTFQRRQVNSVKKDLFGSSSSTEVKKMFDDEIKQHQESAAKKWGFDFRNGQPINSATYSWERVPVPEIVPEMYTLTRAAHVREIITEPPTEQDILMDDRASKENSIDEILSFPFKTPSSPTRSASSNTSPSKMILSCHKSLGKRQPRITEYMKERKRLSQTPKKVSPSKRQRTSSGSTSSLSLFVTSRK